MVTLNKRNDGRYSEAWEYYGKSTDTKPAESNDLNIPNGTAFLEIDTGDVYFWDDSEKEWLKP